MSFDLLLYAQAALLGVVEGVTEFLPISSTGHLILLTDVLGFQGPPGKVFEVAIQSGAIAAVIVVYFQKLLGMAKHVWHPSEEQHLVIDLLLAFVPAVIVGLLFHAQIKAVLFSPKVVAWSLLIGGMILWLIEKYKPTPRYFTAEQLPWQRALGIGFMQCMAMIPGVSRSGATIVGALMLGLERKAAAEFSFLLAIPTMLAATSYDLYKNWDVMDFDAAGLIATGWLAAFLTAMVVVRRLIMFLGKHGFAPFALYRMVLGVVLLVMLY